MRPIEDKIRRIEKCLPFPLYIVFLLVLIPAMLWNLLKSLATIGHETEDDN